VSETEQSLQATLMQDARWTVRLYASAVTSFRGGTYEFPNSVL
jgi:hypothetical protein